MNIESSSIKNTNTSTNISTNKNQNSSVKFTDELNELKELKTATEQQEIETTIQPKEKSQSKENILENSVNPKDEIVPEAKIPETTIQPKAELINPEIITTEAIQLKKTPLQVENTPEQMEETIQLEKTFTREPIQLEEAPIQPEIKKPNDEILFAQKPIQLEETPRQTEIKKPNDEILTQKPIQLEETPIQPAIKNLNTEKNDIQPKEEIQVETNIKAKTEAEPKREETASIIPTEDNKELDPEITLKKYLEELSNIVKKLNQSDEKEPLKLKKSEKSDDNNEKGDDLINNDFNIKEKKDILPQMSMNMNFSGDGQPFSSFMENENQQNSQPKLKVTAQDLAEEEAILSTMEENIQIANKNIPIQPVEDKIIVKTNTKPKMVETPLKIEPTTKAETEPAEKTVNRNDGIKKIDVQTGITIETVVKYDSIIMNEADVEVFNAIVENKDVNLNNLTQETVQKSTQVSKTLADMLAKSQETQQPLRIDFDNGISIIIKISRDGKLSADFLPSTQVAEAYLKENLPILKQRFDEKNLDYEQLNQRERREQHNQENRKKGRRDE